MNQANEKDNVIDMYPRRKIGFTPLEHQTKIYDIERYLENIVKKLIKLGETEEVKKYQKELLFFIDKYKENPYSQFGYALFILTQPEDSEYRYQVARGYVEHGLSIDEKNIDGINLNLRIFSYLIREDKKYLSGAKKFIKEQLEITPDNSDLIIYLKNLEEEYDN